MSIFVVRIEERCSSS